MRSLRLFALFCAALAGLSSIPVPEDDIDDHKLSDDALELAKAAEHRWELERRGVRR